MTAVIDYSANLTMSGIEIRQVVGVVVLIVMINNGPLLLNFRHLPDLAPGTDLERRRETEGKYQRKGSNGEGTARVKRHFQLCTHTSLHIPRLDTKPPIHLLHHLTYASHSLPEPDASSKVLLVRANACVCIAAGFPRGK